MNTVSPHVRKSKRHTIYALIDPRDQAVRYIGITEDVYSRMRQHSRCEGENAAKNAWIQELQEEQLMFIMHSIEQVQTFEMALVRESYWIDWYLQRGADLLNLAGVPVHAQTPTTGFIRYSTDRFLTKLYFRNAQDELVCFADASDLDFIEYLSRYMEENWLAYGKPDAEFSYWGVCGVRCQWINQMRIDGFQLEIYNHRGERVTDLMGNPLKPQAQEGA